MLKTAFRSPCWLCTLRSKSGARKSQILPSKCQIQIVKLQNLNQVKVLQLLELILALKVIEVVLQKAQNRRLKVTTVIYRIHDRKLCQFFENNSWKTPFFFTIFWVIGIPLSFSEFREILPFSASRESYVPNVSMSYISGSINTYTESKVYLQTCCMQLQFQLKHTASTNL